MAIDIKYGLACAKTSVWAKYMKTKFRILPKRSSSGRVGNNTE